MEDLRVTLPIIAVGLTALASLVYVIYIGTQPTVHATCRYQYAVISPSKFNAGSAIVICKLPSGKLISITKPVGWTAPEFDSEMDVMVTK